MNATDWDSFRAVCSGDFADFDSLARFLFESVRLVAFGEECRILEIEFYLNAPHHLDPFVHCDETQKAFAHWYLHRRGGTLKNGSFKGLDLAVGSERAYFGVLIRSIETPTGIVCGPCLCVDYLIERGGCRSIKSLADQIESLDVRSPETQVHFATGEISGKEMIYSSPRVGLSTAHTTKLHAEFGAKNYRFLVRPRSIKKGRPELIQGLGSHGFSAEEIREITGSPARTITKYLGLSK